MRNATSHKTALNLAISPKINLHTTRTTVLRSHETVGCSALSWSIWKSSALSWGAGFSKFGPSIRAVYSNSIASTARWLEALKSLARPRPRQSYGPHGLSGLSVTLEQRDIRWEKHRR